MSLVEFAEKSNYVPFISSAQVKHPPMSYFTAASLLVVKYENKLCMVKIKVF